MQKEKQSYYYNSRNGAGDQTPLSLGDKVLVWDMDDYTWNIPATVEKTVNSRSFVVRLEGERTLRRNRHQL